MGGEGDSLGSTHGQPNKMWAHPQILSTPLPSQPACTWNFTTRDDCPRWVNHPGWMYRTLGDKDTENLFSVPGKELRDFYLVGVTIEE